MDIEIVERLTRIETKLDFYEKQVDLKFNNQKEQVDELKDTHKWFRRTTYGALITAAFSLIMNISQ